MFSSQNSVNGGQRVKHIMFLVHAMNTSPWTSTFYRVFNSTAQWSGNVHGM